MPFKDKDRKKKHKPYKTKARIPKSIFEKPCDSFNRLVAAISDTIARVK